MRGRELPGLGLGFFIAKTLLARAGAKISLENRKFPQRGAIVRIRWKRADFERPVMLEQAGGAVDAPGGPGIEPNIEAPPLAESG
jgi:hypothetical protein